MKLNLFFIIFTIISSCANKTMLPDILEINSQKDMDSWMCELQGLDEFNGNIFIRPSIFDQSSKPIDIHDISILKSLKRINGDLIISNTNLLDLKGFSSLEKVNNIYIGGNNEKIKKIELTNLNSIKGDLHIFGMESLYEINFPQLSKCGSILILDNPKLQNIIGFNKLPYVGEIIVQRCNLNIIDGFNSLEYCEKRLDLEFQDMKVSEGSFGNLNKIPLFNILIAKHNGNFSWLSKLKQCNSFTIAGNVLIDDLCKIKIALIDINFQLISWVNNFKIYTRIDLEKECN